MQATAEAPALKEQSPVTGMQPGRGQEDSVSNTNREVGEVIDGAPREGTVRLDQIEIDGALQSREKLDEATITEYQRIASEAMEEGHPWPFPAVQLIGGRLTDGFHRIETARRLGLREIPAVDRPGDKHDALKAAIGANTHHGLPRSSADKRRAVEMALAVWPKSSNRQIARLAGVSHTMVNSVRSSHVEDSSTAPQESSESAVRIQMRAPGEVSKLDTQSTEFVRALGQLRLGGRLLQGQDPAEDWTSIERLSEGFRVLRFIENQALEINVRDAQQVERVLHATDRDYSMAAGIQPFSILAA